MSILNCLCCFIVLYLLEERPDRRPRESEGLNVISEISGIRGIKSIFHANVIV